MDNATGPMKRDERSTERTPPSERFAPDALQFDLTSAALQLAAEHDKGQSGHRQVALYKHEKTTIALFRFEKGGEMPPHKAPGTVIIQVLEGDLTLDVEGNEHALVAGGLLVLAPGVLHNVKAEAVTLMLLTVSLDGTSKSES